MKHLHTPAPWFYEVSDNTPSMFSVQDDHRTQIAEVERWDGDQEPDVMEQAEANARIIALSPRLFKFVQMVANFKQDGETCKDEDGNPREFSLEADDCVDCIRDLIDEARTITPKELEEI